jgi:hypothetical protein
LVQHKGERRNVADLQDNQNSIARSKLTDITIHARDDICNSFTNGDKHPQQLLSSIPASKDELERAKPHKIDSYISMPPQHNNSTLKGAYKRSLSAFTLLSTSIIFDPASSCITRPDVIMGLIPSSIQVPLCSPQERSDTANNQNKVRSPIPEVHNHQDIFTSTFQPTVTIIERDKRPKTSKHQPVSKKCKFRRMHTNAS